MYDGICDAINRGPECRYDGFDCPSEIPEKCDIGLLRNQVCDEKINTTLCSGKAWENEKDLNNTSQKIIQSMIETNLLW